VFLCRVVGTVVSTYKHDSYTNCKLVLVRPTDSEGNLREGTMVAVDAVNSGIGDWVLLISGGGSSELILDLGWEVPVREVVAGIIDQVEMK
jgi:ethanolamine utilization protein EutN